MRKRPAVNVNDQRAMAEVNKRHDQAAHHFENVGRLAMNGLAELSPHNRGRVLKLIGWLNAAVVGIQANLPGPLDPGTEQERIQRCYARQRYIQQASLIHAALTVFYGGDAECLRMHAITLLGSGKYWTYEIGGKRIPVKTLPVFTRALVENLLHDWQDWHQAENPLAYVADLTRNLAWQEAQMDAPLQFRDGNSDDTHNAVPLEDIIGTPAESSEAGTTTEPRYNEYILLTVVGHRRT